MLIKILQSIDDPLSQGTHFSLLIISEKNIFLFKFCLEPLKKTKIAESLNFILCVQQWK